MDLDWLKLLMYMTFFFNLGKVKYKRKLDRLVFLIIDKNTAVYKINLIEWHYLPTKTWAGKTYSFTVN